MFSHSQSFSSILAEQERQRREKAEKRGKREGKRKSDEGAGSPDVKRRHTPKKKKEDDTPRRRISGQDVGGLLREAGISAGVDGDTDDEEIVMDDDGVESRSPRAKSSRKKTTRSSGKSNGRDRIDSEVIEVNGSSGDEMSKNRGHAGMPAEDEDDESDPELAALAREARQKRLQRTNAATPDATTKSPTPRETSTSSVHNAPQTPPLQDAPVKILVVSHIDGTNPLMVYRKLSQNLREIRLAWCKRQSFDEAFTDRVFLIHRMRRVYDVTTCRSLGLEADAEGNVTMKGAEGKEGVDQVALEAVTQEMYDQMMAKKEQDDAKRRGQWDPAAEAEAEEETVDPEPPTEEWVRIVLKAKGKPDFKLQLKKVSQRHPYI